MNLSRSTPVNSLLRYRRQDIESKHACRNARRPRQFADRPAGRVRIHARRHDGNSYDVERIRYHLALRENQEDLWRRVDARVHPPFQGRMRHGQIENEKEDGRNREDEHEHALQGGDVHVAARFSPKVSMFEQLLQSNLPLKRSDRKLG